jgi:hypothetical protein
MRYCLIAIFIIAVVSVSEAYGGYVFEGDIDYEVTASSELKSSKHAYSANNLKDVNPDNAWCEGSSGKGIGEWLQFDLKGTPGQGAIGLSMRILPGYGKARKLFVANARPSRVSIILTDKRTNKVIGNAIGRSVDLQDALEAQQIDIALMKYANLDTLRMKISIENVYDGAKYDDMCITEIRIFSSKSKDGEPGREERQRIQNTETDELKRLLPAAQRGDKKSMQGLIRLADRSYFRTAEGGEWLAETYLELFYKYPAEFLFLTSKQTEEIRQKVEECIISPVIDKYSPQEIADRIRAVKDNNVIEKYKNKISNEIKKIHGVR